MMGRRTGVAALVGTLSLLGSLLLAVAAQAAPSAQGLTVRNERVCGVPAAAYASCDAIRHYGPSGKGSSGGGGHKPGHEESPPPVSYGAAELQAAYGLTGAAASPGTTVAIVDAYDDPNAASDLAVYRKEQGLTAIAACAPALVESKQLSESPAPCFAKVNQRGKEGAPPNANSSWAQEISLDLDAVSAICPNCNILLVEADSNSLENLGAAVDEAASFDPAAIGNSYGASEFSSEAEYAGHYSHSNIAITVSTGDNGYGVEFPAAAAMAIAVGGTSLRYEAGAWKQTVWSGSGSGCSAYISKPTWQRDTGCGKRTVADVAAVADPNTGLEVYDSYGGTGGWLVFGGTSASAQIIAGVYGLAGGGVSDASGLYTGSAGVIPFGSTNPHLTDITSGSNGSCTGRGRFVNPSLAYLCTGEPGYDGPTGMGTPLGITAF